MSLDEKFIPVRTVFNETVGNFFQEDSWIIGIPITGNAHHSRSSKEVYTRSKSLDNLLRHRTSLASTQRPGNVV
jgi:hypothetical protein